MCVCVCVILQQLRITLMYLLNFSITVNIVLIVIWNLLISLKHRSRALVLQNILWLPACTLAWVFACVWAAVWHTRSVWRGGVKVNCEMLLYELVCIMCWLWVCINEAHYQWSTRSTMDFKRRPAQNQNCAKVTKMPVKSNKKYISIFVDKNTFINIT